MALKLDLGTAKIAWKTSGAAAGVDVRREHVLLHCTKNASLQAGDTARPGKVNSGHAVEIEGTAFLEATANEFDIGGFEFGMVQISQLNAYQFLFVGRMASEGSTIIDLRLGYTRNPSLDVEPATGETIDQHIFSTNNLTVGRVVQGRKGFNVKVSFGDHPFNAIPLRFENRKAGAPNFIARATRNEAFVTYFVARERTGAPITILARLGWTVNWDAEFNWSAAAMQPTKLIKTSLLFPGEARNGTPPADAMSMLALTRSGPTTNSMDADATSAAWKDRREPICMQSRERPPGFRSNFFQ